MGRRNKQQRDMEALAQAHGDPTSKNEDLERVDNKTDSGDDVLEINIDIFSSVIQSNLNSRLYYYYGDSYCTNQRRRSYISKSAQLTVQLF